MAHRNRDVSWLLRCLAIAVLLATVCVNGMNRVLPRTNCEFDDHSVVHHQRQPSECPCLRSREFVRLSVDLKSSCGGHLWERVRVGFGSPVAKLDTDLSREVSGQTLQSQYVRLQV